MLYLTYGLLGGIGTGIVYVGVVGHMVQWFPDKRGLATGLVAAGYGIGALLTTFPIAAVLRESTLSGCAHALRPDLRRRRPGSRRRGCGAQTQRGRWPRISASAQADHGRHAPSTSRRSRCSARRSSG